MKIIPCSIPGPLVIEPTVFGDNRGFFLESWNEKSFADAGLSWQFVQDNHSSSQKGVLRGMHFQNPNPQGKLVRVVCGAVFDVAVDMRKSSPHFGKWVGVKISEENKRIFWIPEGFAHGFLSLTDNTHFLYKCTAPYSRLDEHCLAWNDPTVGIDWPGIDGPIQLSAKDQAGISLDLIDAFA